MKSELLCKWLGLAKTTWPPDPWTLLGLPPDEYNLCVIEQRVQECMAKLRTYQLSYPDEATEGMNRLAEAFIKLAEASSKQSTPVGAAAATKRAKQDTMVIEQTKLDWRAEPPPVRVDDADGPDEPVLEEDSAANEVMAAQPFVAPSKPHERTIDANLMRALGQESEEATSNVGTLDAVIDRVEITRQLLHAWERVGKLLKSIPKKGAAKEAEGFARRLAEIADVMKKYPAFLGQPGRPGYRVVVLAKFKVPLSIARAIGGEQRDDLLFDWQAGRAVLLEHRKYLRRQLRSMRSRTSFGLFVHAVRAFVNDYPGPTLIGVTLLVALAVVVGMAMWWR